MGDPDFGRQLIAQAIAERDETGHVGMISTNRLFLPRLELNRDDPTATLRAAETLLTFSSVHDIAHYARARGRLFDPEAGVRRLRQTVADYLALNNKNSAPLSHGLIADLEAMTAAPTALWLRLSWLSRWPRRRGKGGGILFSFGAKAKSC
jgi:hypothetical protein